MGTECSSGRWRLWFLRLCRFGLDWIEGKRRVEERAAASRPRGEMTLPCIRGTVGGGAKRRRVAGRTQ